MQALRQFSIPIKGLKNGSHEFVFQIRNNFFSAFENTPISDCELDVKLNLEKKSDHMILDFYTKGLIQTECDRCTALINLPVEKDYEVIVKYDDSKADEGEVIYISPDAHELKIASLIYEHIILALPLIKVYDCENERPQPCNMKILSILSERSEKGDNQLGDALKNLNLD